MNINLRLLTGAALLLLGNLTISKAQDSCTFEQELFKVNNVDQTRLTVEMESTTLKDGYWVKQTDIPGSQGGYIQYVGGDATGDTTKSILTYTLKIHQAGLHSFKIRAYREDYHDNDVWVRFPHGGVMTKINNDSTGSKGSKWFKAMIGQEDKWYAFAKTQHVGTAWGETLHDIYVRFPEPGVYTVQFAGRATGFRLDRFYIYQASSYYGMGEDPGSLKPESPKINCQPYATTVHPYVANPLLDQSVNGNTAWTYTFDINTFVNPTGGNLNYQAFLGNMLPLPSWITFNAATRTFTGNPTYADGGKYNILVKAQSNGKFAVDAFVLTVLGNNPPIMSTILKDTTIEVGDAFTLDMNDYFTDSDDHTIAYIASSHEGNLPSWISLTGSTFEGTPGTADIGNDTIYVIADDGNGGSISESFVIKIKSATIQGIKNVSKINASLYPNPAENTIYIKTQETGEGTITISDNMGRVYFAESNIVLNKEIMLDLASMNMNSGLYIIRVKSDKGSEFSSMIVKK
jgi:hypothetical protein